MLCWILVDTVRGGKPSALGACIGAVVGLVAITPAAGFVSPGASVFIGVFSAAVSNFAVHWKSTKTTIDDTLDVFPCHGLGGITGMILTAVFASQGGLVTGSSTLFFNHLLALLIVSIFTFGGSFILYKLTDYLIPIRVAEDKEDIGLDLSQHGESIE
jgi:Amt family ammonium transporter